MLSPILKFTGTGTGAEFSPCKKYKYAEYIRLDRRLPSISFILLNPTADLAESIKIKRCIAHAKSWGYGEVYITYLFAYITPYVQQLSRAQFVGIDIVGCDNNLKGIGNAMEVVVCAWGIYGGIGNRDKAVLAMFPDKAHYIELSDLGYPREPGSLKMNLPLKKYSSVDLVVL